MLKFLLYALLFFIVAILQTVVVPHIEILGARPAFLLILTIMMALKHGTLAGCFWGFMSGLLYDVYAPIEWLGAYSLAFCMIGYAIGQIEDSFISLSLIPKIIVLALACLLKDVIYFLAIGRNGDEILNTIISISVPDTLYTICIGAILFYIFVPHVQKKIDIYR